MPLINSGNQIIPFCRWYKTKIAIMQFEQDFKPMYPRILMFYDRKRKMTMKRVSNDLLFIDDRYNRLFHTEHEYVIAIENHLQRYSNYSYIEVHNSDGFICRRFVRNGILAPHISTEEDVSKCPYIRLPLISDKPMLNIKQMLKDKPPGFNPDRFAAEVEFNDRGSDYKKLLYKYYIK